MSRSRRLVTSVAALSMVATTAFAGGAAFAEESPEATEAETTAEETPAEDEAEESEAEEEAEPDPDGPIVPGPKNDSGELEVSIGQSVQVRVNADGEPNADLINFRWTATQVVAEGTTGESIDIFLPMAPAPMLRSLEDFGKPEQTDDGVIFAFEDVNGVEPQRTLNLWPQDKELDISMRAEFTLDGEPVKAQDIVGKGGVVTATYIATNNTTQQKNVRVENLAGEEVAVETETDVPFVIIAFGLYPQTWARYNPGNGIVGADGRGNWQTQWISLPFRPIAEDGVSKFGFSAVIPDGEGFIPRMTALVAPLFHPASDEAEEEEAAAEDDGSGPPPPNLSPGLNQASAGLSQLLLGLEGTVGTIGASFAGIVTGLIEGAPEIIEAAQELQEILGPSDPNEPSLDEKLTEVIQFLDEAIDTLNGLIGEGGTLDPDRLRQLADLIANIDQGTLNTILTFLRSGACTVATELTRAQCDTLADVIEGISDLDPGNIREIASFIEGVSTILLPTLTVLRDTLASLQESLATVGPPVSQLLGALGTIIANEIGGLAELGALPDDLADIQAGGAQVSAGLDAVSAELGAYIAQVTETVQASLAAAGEAVDSADEALVHLRAGLTGMKERMHDSPLPYNGPQNDAGIEYTNNLFGAYQFMFDPADNNHPNTLPRILIALLLLVGAGFAGRAVMSSRGGAALGGAAAGAAAGGAAAASAGDDSGSTPDWLHTDDDDETREVPGVSS